MITRTNYEEYFLLYVDNELSAADREVVERFVADNPDLQEEWNTFLSCRVEPDEELVFSDRQSLFRSSPNELTADTDPDYTTLRMPVGKENYEAWFIAYIENELNEDNRKAVEAFALQHPPLLKELELFRKTIAQPDLSIVFPDKESLYRQEKEKKVFFLPWMRIAAAAALVGIAGLLVFYYLNKNNGGGASGKKSELAVTPQHTDSLYYSKGSEVKKTQTGIDNSNNQPKDKEQKRAMDPNRSPSDQQGLATQDQQKQHMHFLVRPGRPTRTVDPKRPPSDQQDLARAGGDHPDRSASIRENDPSATPENVIKRAGQMSRVRLAESTQKREDAVVAVSGLNPNTTIASHAVYSSTTNDNTEEDELVTESSDKKTKLRGLFRKVSRVFEKTTSADDPDGKHKVLIGSFQFALK